MDLAVFAQILIHELVRGGHNVFICVSLFPISYFLRSNFVRQIKRANRFNLLEHPKVARKSNKVVSPVPLSQSPVLASSINALTPILRDISSVLACASISSQSPNPYP